MVQHTYHFYAEDHPDCTIAVGCLPLLVSPTIHNLKVTKMLVGGGAGLNLISPKAIKRLQIPDGDLEETGTFQGINPGRSQPKGKITLPVTFGGDLNYKTEKIIFDVAEIPLPYNGILGRPALTKFLAASHYAYNTSKMPSPMSIIIVGSDKKDALICTCCQGTCSCHWSSRGEEDRQDLSRRQDLWPRQCLLHPLRKMRLPGVLRSR